LTSLLLTNKLERLPQTNIFRASLIFVLYPGVSPYGADTMVGSW